MSKQVEVTELPPCDFCMEDDPTAKPFALRPVGKVDALYDGKTKFGPWANMCQEDFDKYGVGLGTGKGQRLVLR